jgi:GMP synthase (glutamine-hydrolysing)
MIIDPALRTPELECLNSITLSAPLPVTYHLPAMFGLNSLREETLDTVRGIIILGSASTVNDRAAWQIDLEVWLKPVLERRIPTLGLCYGHQMLAHLFGGRIEYMFADLTKHKGFRVVSVDATGPWKKSQGSLVVSHNEHVTVVPSSMKVIAKSSAVAVDGLAHKELPVYSFQAHPEATRAFLKNQGIEQPQDVQCFDFGTELIASFLSFAVTYKN